MFFFLGPGVLHWYFLPICVPLLVFFLHTLPPIVYTIIQYIYGTRARSTTRTPPYHDKYFADYYPRFSPILDYFLTVGNLISTRGTESRKHLPLRSTAEEKETELSKKKKGIRKKSRTRRKRGPVTPKRKKEREKEANYQSTTTTLPRPCCRPYSLFGASCSDGRKTLAETPSPPPPPPTDNHFHF